MSRTRLPTTLVAAERLGLFSRLVEDFQENQLFGLWFEKRHRSHLLQKALSKRPLALLDSPGRSVVSWTAKSACTVALIWHLERLGLLSDAQNHHPRLHRYRQNVMYKSPQYRDAKKQAGHEGARFWTYIKVVRDPWRRCISSYRHALKTGYANQTMSSILGYPVSHEVGFSFETFLEFLERIDLRTSNPHHRFQSHELDGFDWERVFLVKIDDMDLASSLSYIDDYQRRPRAFESQLVVRLVHSDRGRYVAPENTRPVISDQEIWRHLMSNRDLNTWPQKSLFESTSAFQRAKTLYSQDYEMLNVMGARSEPMPEWVMKS